MIYVIIDTLLGNKHVNKRQIEGDGERERDRERKVEVVLIRMLY